MREEQIHLEREKKSMKSSDSSVKFVGRPYIKRES